MTIRRFRVRFQIKNPRPVFACLSLPLDLTIFRMLSGLFFICLPSNVPQTNILATRGLAPLGCCPSCAVRRRRFSLRKAEIASITTQTNFAGFYDRLRAIREYHAKFPETAAVTLHELESGSAEGGAGGGAEFAAPAPVIHFSGEENFGRHLDMHALHERMLNMPDQV